MALPTDAELIARAKSVIRPREIQNVFMVGEVGCASCSLTMIDLNDLRS